MAKVDVGHYSADKIKVFKMMDHGVDIRDAYEIIKGAVPKSSSISIANQQYEKWKLNNPKKIRKASRVIENILDAKPIITNAGKEIYPSHAVQLAAAEMVYDRVEPKKGSEQAQNEDFHPVNLNVYVNPSVSIQAPNQGEISTASAQPAIDADYSETTSHSSLALPGIDDSCHAVEWEQKPTYKVMPKLKRDLETKEDTGPY